MYMYQNLECTDNLAFYLKGIIYYWNTRKSICFKEDILESFENKWKISNFLTM